MAVDIELPNDSPVVGTFFVSHGSPRTLVDETPTTAFYQQIGQYARAKGVTAIVWMGGHWETPFDRVEISCPPAGTHPDKDFVAFVPDEILDWYKQYRIPAQTKLAHRCHDKLRDAGFHVSLNAKAVWHQDVMIPLRWMYPDDAQCPPMALISVNGRYDAHFHLKIGQALRSLRHERVLLMGSGGGIHNLYRLYWHHIIVHKDTMRRTQPITEYAGDFAASMRSSCTDVQPGPQLGASLCRLLSHPHFYKCNPTAEHFLPLLYVAGGCSSHADRNKDAAHPETVNIFGGENWEMNTQLNSNFAFGITPADVDRFFPRANIDQPSKV